MARQYAKGQPTSFTNRINNVAIVGASGQVGQHILVAMLANNNYKKITAITRAEADTPMPPGVAVARVNYNDPSSLVDALKGNDALVITLAARAPPEVQIKLIDAAAEAGVPWVFPNEYSFGSKSKGLDRPQKKSVRDYIESKELSWTGMACGFWYEYSLARGELTFGIDSSAKQVTWFDDGEQKITVSSLPQTGRGIAALLNLPILPEDENDKRTTLSGFRNEFAYIGSFTVSQKDIFASVLRITNSEESDWTFKSEPSKARYERSDVDFQQKQDRTGFVRAMYARVFFREDNGDMSLWGGLGKLDNGRLGLQEEIIDERTKVAIRKMD